MSSKRFLVVAMAGLFAACAMAADSPKPSPSAKKSVDTEAADKAKAAPAAAESASDEKAPRLTIVEPVKDYGTIPKGDKLEWAFLVKNTGDADLQIIAAKPGCGCTVTDFDKVIKPGTTGKVTAHVDTTAFAGPIAKSVTLETNDPNTPTAQLTIHAIVKPFVEAYPAGFTRFNLLQGDADTQTVTLYSEEDEPFEIKNIEVPGDWVKATFSKIEKKEDLAPNVGKAGQNQYKVAITVGGPDAKIGPLADRIRVFTNSKHQPEYSISISGVVRPTLRVDPPGGVNFGEVAPTDSAATRSILVHTNDTKTPESFTVTKAESSVPTVVTSIKPGANRGDYEVTLQLAKDSKPGDIDGTVKIYTSDKKNPVVT
ncbi:MAG TPA: DUF1573 domain-containing protein, partial [Thermoanaerobaculia bacterium]|nr:DUF1573 domain-containing protein [Thermoanaerobaculia bacterium]